MRTFAPILRYLVPVALLGALAHFVLLQEAEPVACKEPLLYSVSVPDSRFAISEAEFVEAVDEASSLWNEASGTELFLRGESGIQVSLQYDERQEALNLGESIESEQQEYRAMKEEIDAQREVYVRERNAYERAVRAYDARVSAYERDVESWNDRGGAPPAVYAQFATRKAELEREQADLGSDAARIEALGRDINAKVAFLNTLVARINSGAEIFNETLGHDFDQGHYTTDGDIERITVYTFENKEELVRVLAHEFGHALGIGHVENPDSLMYAYNFGDALSLSEEDRAALAAVCN